MCRTVLQPPLQDSDVLSRRALLGGVTFFGASALLSACGQQVNSEASASSTATDAASTRPSQTSSASESPSASTTPSTVRGYSGGSKAPDGEYRKADAKGPAQNVPKPPEPEEGYREKSISGLEKTIHAWMNYKNYAIQTGDYSGADAFVSPTFEVERNFNKKVEDLYKKGGWVIDGLAHLKLMVRRGLRMGRRIFGVLIVSGLLLFMFSLMVVGRARKTVILRTICGISSCVIMASAG